MMNKSRRVFTLIVIGPLAGCLTLLAASFGNTAHEYTAEGVRVVQTHPATDREPHAVWCQSVSAKTQSDALRQHLRELRESPEFQKKCK